MNVFDERIHSPVRILMELLRRDAESLHGGIASKERPWCLGMGELLSEGSSERVG